MSDIIKGFSNLIASIVEIFKGVFSTAFGAVESALGLVVGIFRNLFNVAEGFIGFILGKVQILVSRIKLIMAGNIFVIGTIAAVYFAYVLYQQRQGRAIAPKSQ
jgi:phage-related protein